VLIVVGDDLRRSAVLRRKRQIVIGHVVRKLVGFVRPAHDG
jgi:hypothetical protein